MMTCSELAGLLDDYVGRELAEERRATADGHLARCPSCVALLESYQITIQLTRRLPCHPLPSPLVVRLEALLSHLPAES